MTIASLIERLEAKAADIADWNGETMKAWDRIRHQVQTHKGSDLPRMNFESLVEDHAELMLEAATALRTREAGEK